MNTAIKNKIKENLKKAQIELDFLREDRESFADWDNVANLEIIEKILEDIEIDLDFP